MNHVNINETQSNKILIDLSKLSDKLTLKAKIRKELGYV